MFQIYLLFIIFLLITICYFISNDILKIISRNTILYNIYQNIQEKYVSPDHNHNIKAAKAYIYEKKWLSCILMLEFYIDNQSNNIEAYYSLIALCYYNLNLYKYAKKYYLKAIQIYPKNIITLHQLAETYKKCKEIKSAIAIYQQIYFLDPHNKIAKHNINNLSNKHISG
uniref:Uncharacterized protein n=1 Tax=Sebdenia flabellata TaxID=42024 RepID=A0A1C9C9Z5_9FLOR|nr:hypothetical protein Sebd_111 [Sebdenia flabellata]AOM65198.1 hypothetical protein Sebd_111 [Sebdenia flabellata]